MSFLRFNLLFTIGLFVWFVTISSVARAQKMGTPWEMPGLDW